MATGERLISAPARSFSLPAATPASFGTRAGGSTPGELIEFLAFGDAADAFADVLVNLPENYAGGGITITLKWMAASATTGDVVWGAAVRAIPDDAEDVDGAHTYDYNEATGTTASATGEFQYTNITFTDGVDMDSWAVPEDAVLRIRRNGDDAGDTMTGNAQLVSISIKET